jgi:hypothetical protein
MLLRELERAGFDREQVRRELGAMRARSESQSERASQRSPRARVYRIGRIRAGRSICSDTLTRLAESADW